MSFGFKIGFSDVLCKDTLRTVRLTTHTDRKISVEYFGRFRGNMPHGIFLKYLWNILKIFPRSFTEIFQRIIYGIFREDFMKYYEKDLKNILKEYSITYSSFLPRIFHIQVSIEHSIILPKIFQWKI